MYKNSKDYTERSYKVRISSKSILEHFPLERLFYCLEFLTETLQVSCMSQVIPRENNREPLFYVFMIASAPIPLCRYKILSIRVAKEVSPRTSLWIKSCVYLWHFNLKNGEYGYC